MRRLPTEVAELPIHLRATAELEALEPRERDVLALCLLEKLSPIEAAGALRMTVGELNRVLSSTLDRLAAALAAPESRRTASKRAA